MASNDYEPVVISVKRTGKKGEYYDHVKAYDGKKIFYRDYVYRNKLKNREDYYGKVIRGELLHSNKKYAKVIREKKEEQIRNTAPKQVRGKGYYQTSIKMFLIARYKNKTPFFIPPQRKSSITIVSNNRSEKYMIRSHLNYCGEGNYEDFNYWMDRWKANKEVKIFGGWTYKRTFSGTGSFNGDTQYLDFVERRFSGRKMNTYNYFKMYRKKQQQPMIDYKKGEMLPQRHTG